MIHCNFFNFLYSDWPTANQKNKPFSFHTFFFSNKHTFKIAANFLRFTCGPWEGRVLFFCTFHGWEHPTQRPSNLVNLVKGSEKITVILCFCVYIIWMRVNFTVHMESVVKYLLFVWYCKCFDADSMSGFCDNVTSVYNNGATFIMMIFFLQALWNVLTWRFLVELLVSNDNLCLEMLMLHYWLSYQKVPEILPSFYNRL